MIKKITIINTYNETLELELDNPYTTGIVITNITGLGPVKADINTVDNAMRDGSLFNSARMASRNIVMSLRLLEDPTTNLVETTRHRVYKYFPEKERITFRILTDEMECETDGYVESCEPDIFQKEETQQVSIICPDPYFYDLVSGNTISPDYNYMEMGSGWTRTRRVKRISEESIGDNDLPIEFIVNITGGSTKDPELSLRINATDAGDWKDGTEVGHIKFDSSIIDKMLYKYWTSPISSFEPSTVIMDSGVPVWHISTGDGDAPIIAYNPNNKLSPESSYLPPSPMGDVSCRFVNLYGTIFCVGTTYVGHWAVGWYRLENGVWVKKFISKSSASTDDDNGKYPCVLGDYIYLLYTYSYSDGVTHNSARCLRIRNDGTWENAPWPPVYSGMRNWQVGIWGEYSEAFSDRTTPSTRPSYMYIPYHDRDDTQFDGLYRFDGSTYTKITNNFPFNSQYLDKWTSWVMLNGTVHVIGGNGGDSSVYLTHWILSGTSWTVRSTLPIMVGKANTAIINGKIHIIPCLDYTRDVPESDRSKYYNIWVFDESSSTWSRIGDGGITAGDQIYISTKDNAKQAILTRPGVSKPYNLLPAISKDSKWFKLQAHKGVNTLNFSLQSNPNFNETLIFKKKHKGV